MKELARGAGFSKEAQEWFHGLGDLENTAWLMASDLGLGMEPWVGGFTEYNLAHGL